MRRACWCTNQYQNVAQVIHNNWLKFPDFFLYCCVHQHGHAWRQVQTKNFLLHPNPIILGIWITTILTSILSLCLTKWYCLFHFSRCFLWAYEKRKVEFAFPNNINKHLLWQVTWDLKPMTPLRSADGKLTRVLNILPGKTFLSPAKIAGPSLWKKNNQGGNEDPSHHHKCHIQSLLGLLVQLTWRLRLLGPVRYNLIFLHVWHNISCFSRHLGTIRYRPHRTLRDVYDAFNYMNFRT